MAETPAIIVSDYLRKIAADPPCDAELLARFAATNDGDAFALLVRRYGPMVLGVCRRGAGDAADDAFQATFLALARQAGRVTESLPGWLHRVATRIARRSVRRPTPALPADTTDETELFSSVEWKDLRAVLDAELAALPNRLRTPLVLCYLEGLTRDEAARQTGCSLRTLHRRLEQGRRRLRDRLTRRGLAPVLLGASVLTADGLRAAVPPSLAQKAIDLATGASAIPLAISQLLPTAAKRVLMKTLVALVILAGGISAAIAGRQPATAETPELKPAEVVRTPLPKPEEPDRTKVAAVAWLVKQQDADGSWETMPLTGVTRGGQTALAVVALLEIGLKPVDATVTKGLDYLRGLKSEGTYVVSLQTQALCLAGQKQDAELIKAKVAWLEKTANRDDGGKLIGWSYGANRGADNSNTGYAVAALYAAHKAGYKVANAGLWDEIGDFFVRTQCASRGWGYIDRAPRATPTMTCAALACLAHSQDATGKKRDDVAAALKLGLAWLAENFAMVSAQHQFYWLDVLAHMGRATGRAKLGDHDWRREAAEWLAKNQHPDGHFQGGPAGESNPTVSTALALRCLSERP